MTYRIAPCGCLYLIGLDKHLGFLSAVLAHAIWDQTHPLHPAEETESAFLKDYTPENVMNRFDVGGLADTAEETRVDRALTGKVVPFSCLASHLRFPFLAWRFFLTDDSCYS